MTGSHGVVGVGMDAVEVDRFRRVLARTPSLATRVFTEAELEYARRANDPTERLAVRFAAKEAAMKALGSGIGAFRFADVEVVRGRHDQEDAPALALHNGAARRAEERSVVSLHVSMTHTAQVAMATVIAVGEPAPPSPTTD